MINVRFGKRFAVTAAIIAAFLVLVYWPALRWMVNSWLSSDYYSHGFLVPLVSAFFIWTKRDALKYREGSLLGIIWLIAAAALYVFSLLWQLRFLASLSLLCVIYGLVFSLFGLRTFKALLFPLAFLLFMVPFWFVQNLAYQLQALTVLWSSRLGAAVGLPITTSGVEIFLGNVTFTVGVVCSGIDSLVALLALGAVYAYILKGPAAKRYGLFVLAFPIAIAANTLRIVSIIVVAYFTNVEIATGWYHDLSSPLFFFIAFGVLILVARGLKLRLSFK